jgi:D-alanine-D-alanine ligase
VKVAVLFDRVPPGARADEADALDQAAAIEAALEELGHDHARVGLTLDLSAAARELRQIQPDVVFNIVESIDRHGRLAPTAPALLDALGLAYTGAPAEALYLTTSKLLTKQLLHAHGIDTPAWFCLEGPRHPAPPLPGRYIVKSVWEDASIGLEDDSVVEVADLDQLRREVSSRTPKLGGQAFAEVYVAGREFNISVVGGEGDRPRALPPAEIHFVGYPDDRPKVVGYRAKWDDTSYEFHNTPRSFEFPASDAALLDRLRALSEQCWTVFGIRGYARVDFRVDESGTPFVLELNANPCLSPDAGFAAAVRQAGIGFTDLVRRLLDDALARSK